MNLAKIEFPFTLLTPCFSGTWEGKTGSAAEMRVPAVRGMIRYWHRQLFGNNSANAVWGSAAGNEGRASKVAVSLVFPVASTQNSRATLLPHKEENRQGPRPALAVGNTYTLTLRLLPGCTKDEWEKAKKAVKCWLLLGCLGLRSNRAAGSVWPVGDWVPTTSDTFKTCLTEMGYKQPVSIAGLGKNLSADALRKTASDTVGGSPNLFGRAGNERKPSPTKFKVIHLGEEYALAITGPDLKTAHRNLNDKHQPQLWKALGEWMPIVPPQGGHRI